MNRRQLFVIGSSLLVALQATLPLSASAETRRNVAVMPFTTGAVQSEVNAEAVGNQVESMVYDSLAQSAKYKLYDRHQLDAILKEQNLSVSDRASQGNALQIGKIVPVDALIYGTVQNLGFEKKEHNVGASSFGGYGIGRFGYGGLGGGGVHTKSGKCKATVSVYMVDTTDGAVLASITESGESSRSGASIWGGWSGTNANVGGGSSDFSSSIAGEAVTAALDKIKPKLEELSAKIPERHNAGKVADISGQTVTVTMGKNQGVGAGDNLEVDRVAKTITDPDTGKIIKEVTNTLAVITVDSAEDSTASGKIVKGSGVKVGDRVKKITTDVSAVIINAPDSGSVSTSATGTVLGKKGAGATTGSKATTKKAK